MMIVLIYMDYYYVEKVCRDILLVCCGFGISYS
jgi:hypothetical protein